MKCFGVIMVIYNMMHLWMIDLARLYPQESNTVKC